MAGERAVCSRARRARPPVALRGTSVRTNVTPPVREDIARPALASARHPAADRVWDIGVVAQRAAPGARGARRRRPSLFPAPLHPLHDRELQGPLTVQVERPHVDSQR